MAGRKQEGSTKDQSKVTLIIQKNVHFINLIRQYVRNIQIYNSMYLKKHTFLFFQRFEF